MSSVMTALRLAGLTLLAALLTTRGLAQTSAPQPPPPPSIPQDPVSLTFDVSQDHDAVDASGPRVLKYLIEFSPIDNLGKPKTVDLGKPAAPDGVIVVTLATVGLAPGRYVAQARVVGPTTTATSGVVGPFQLGKPKVNKGSAPSRTAAAPPPNPSAPAPAAAPAPTAPAPTGSGDQTPKREETDPKKRGFWQKLYGLIVG
jgi:hypothetical protein